MPNHFFAQTGHSAPPGQPGGVSYEELEKYIPKHTKSHHRPRNNAATMRGGGMAGRFVAGGLHGSSGGIFGAQAQLQQAGASSNNDPLAWFNNANQNASPVVQQHPMQQGDPLAEWGQVNVVALPFQLQQQNNNNPSARTLVSTEYSGASSHGGSDNDDNKDSHVNSDLDSYDTDPPVRRGRAGGRAGSGHAQHGGRRDGGDGQENKRALGGRGRVRGAGAGRGAGRGGPRVHHPNPAIAPSGIASTYASSFSASSLASSRGEEDDNKEEAEEGDEDSENKRGNMPIAQSTVRGTGRHWNQGPTQRSSNGAQGANLRPSNLRPQQQEKFNYPQGDNQLPPPGTACPDPLVIRGAHGKKWFFNLTLNNPAPGMAARGQKILKAAKTARERSGTEQDARLQVIQARQMRPVILEEISSGPRGMILLLKKGNEAVLGVIAEMKVLQGEQWDLLGAGIKKYDGYYFILVSRALGSGEAV